LHIWLQDVSNIFFLAWRLTDFVLKILIFNHHLPGYKNKFLPQRLLETIIALRELHLLKHILDPINLLMINISPHKEYEKAKVGKPE
jgi:hypothetical protein